MLLLDNDWRIFRWKNIKDDSDVPENDLTIMCGGDTNVLTITIHETEDVKTEKDMEEVFNNKFYKRRYPDTWEFTELEKRRSCIVRS